MKIILLEKVAGLGNLGDEVTVKNGYGRNFLLPQKKALRATKENVAYFESQRKAIEADNDKRKVEAEKTAKTLDGQSFTLLRQAGEKGQLFGSVRPKDVADAAAKFSLTKNQVEIGEPVKSIGLYDIDVRLHAEVVATVRINVARTDEEAKYQIENPEKFLGGIQVIDERAAEAEERAAEREAAAAKRAAPANESETEAEEATDEADADAESTAEGSSEDSSENKEKSAATA